jgi:hypothetical protein
VSEQDYVSNCSRLQKTRLKRIECERTGERERERGRERDRYWKDGPFVKTDGTSTEASRNEPKAVEK